MSYTPWFPEPGAYIKYWDAKDRIYKYRKLLWKRAPLRYPIRIPSLSAGTKRSSGFVLDEINPSETKRHIYLAYLGVQPGFLYYFYHPYDIKLLKWDEDITDIDEDLTATITYEASPYEFPTFSFGVEHNRYPAVQPYNISGAARTPEIIVVASLYRVVEHNDLSDEERSKLEAGSLRSHPWDFGGEL